MRSIIYIALLISFSANAEMRDDCKKAKIIAYTKEQCGYCKKFKSLMDNENITYENVEVTGKKILLNWLISSTNEYTVPYIFMDEKYIGGFTDFVRLCYKG